MSAASSPFNGVPAALLPAATAALAHLQQGRGEAAANAFAALLKHVPDHAGVLRLAALAERHCHRLPAAVALLRRAAERAPDDPLVAASLGLSVLAQSPEQGLAELRRACELAPQVAAFWNNLGKALLDQDRVPEAIPALQQALRRQPDFREPRYSLAYACAVSGEIDAAAQHYRQLLAQRPDDGEAWIGLAQLKSRQLDAADLAAMRALLTRTTLHPADRIAMEFACADTLHGQGDYAAAFAAWQRANAGVRARHPWDAAAFAARADAALVQRWPLASSAAPAHNVLFVVGLPRSGTSIVEQILACHSEVAAAGESAALGAVLQAEIWRRGGEFPAALASLDEADWCRLGAAYLAELSGRLPSRPWVTDKLPGNWLYIGPILAMLPNARIIACRREPLEAAFSCYRQRFAGENQGFSYAMADIGVYWRRFDAAITHWRARYPQRVFELDYEALVRTPEPIIRALLAFAGLPFEPACLHPEQNPRAVRTMSAGQVRQPLRPGSAVTARYGTLLDPLRAALFEGR
ncbi:MAG TPA: sulfotransferase [Rhodanobacteraceae bacterium]|nr:sulfotransferase [Rhodanobacteraceae bacterium]